MSYRSAIRCRALIAIGLTLIAASGCYSIAPGAAAPSAATQLAPTLPDMQNVAQPNPQPAAPSAWDVFAPPVSATPALSGTPAIAESTRTGAPGDSLILTGNSFSNNVGSAAGEDTQFLVYGQSGGSNATQASASILRLDGLKAAIALPAGLPAWSTYFVWAANSAGYGYPIAVNRTEAWWVGPDQAAGGDTVSVYGRNLSHGNGTTNSWVYLQLPGAAGQWAATTSVNPYRVQFTVPASLAPGTYEIWVHNGHGGNYGWSGPLSLVVTAPYSWNGDTFNVRTYGAKGDGVTDDTSAIGAAYNAAVLQMAQTGLHPTLYFPTGTYMVNHGICFCSNLRYLGDGMNLSYLKCNAQFAQLPSNGDKLGLFFANGGLTNNVEVNGLTLDANGNFSSIANDDHLVFCQFAPGSSDIHFINVRVQILVPGFGCSFMNSVTRLSYVGCQFIGGDAMSFNSTQHDIEGCTFLGANDSPMSIIQRGTSELSISGCSAANYDDNSPTGQGLGRFLAANGDYGTQSNVYVGGNTTANCGPRVGASDPNSGEHVLCEGNDNLYEGNPSAATLTSVAFGNLSVDYTGQTAIITSGPGLGQYRSITGFNSATMAITVSPAWNVAPNSTSVVVIGGTANHWAVYDNVLDGKASYTANDTAMTGIELYGGCFDWIGDGNTITRMCVGVYVAGLEQSFAPVGINPSFFNTFVNNVLQSCYEGVYVGCSIPVRTNDTGIAVLGNLFRDNTLTGITDAGASFFTTTPSTPGTPLDMTLLDQNTFTNLPQGIDCDQLSVGSRTCNILAVRNTIGLGTASSAGGFGMHFGTATSSPGLGANTWSNFGASTYSGTTPGAILEAPIRCFSADGSTTSNPQAPLTIANSGTSALDWTATSDSPWITLSSGAGVIAPENSTTLTLTCNPSNLQPGTYLGTVTLSGSSQTKVLTVSFTVASATGARTRRASRMEKLAIPAVAPKVSAVVIQCRPGRAV